jgi:hypothetical protein
MPESRKYYTDWDAAQSKTHESGFRSSHWIRRRPSYFNRYFLKFITVSIEKEFLKLMNIAAIDFLLKGNSAFSAGTKSQYQSRSQSHSHFRSVSKEIIT